MNRNKILQEVALRNWVILIFLGGTSFIFMSPAFTTGVFLGGLLMIANFHSLSRNIRKMFSDEGILVRKKKLSIILNFYFRLAILGIIIYISCKTALVDVIGLTIGLAVVLLSIVTLAVCPVR